MSTNDEPSTKKRRLRGACDACKLRKIRCDSAKMPGGICSTCLGAGAECTHELKTKKGKPTVVSPPDGMGNHSPLAEVSLEFFQQHSEIRATVAAILSTTTPYAVPREFSVVRLRMVELARYIEELEKALEAAYLPLNPPSPAEVVTPTPKLTPNHHDTHALVGDPLCVHLLHMTLDQSTTRFYGRSSNLMLLRSVIEVRKEFVGQDELSGLPKRPSYWRVHPWQLPPEPMHAPLVFPEPDLLHDLIDLYFLNYNQYMPLFHRPTFDRLIDDNIHLVNHQFGMTVLGVIAIGARYSHDPRVLEDEVDAGRTELGVGWKYYRQISLIRTSFMVPTTLYELQLYCICIFYLQGTSTPENCWFYLGLAVRFIQDIGLHRKSHNPYLSRNETELRKRAFWVIICTDVILSSFLGRPRAISTDDYDQDLPVDCDDEYWDHPDPEQAFKQPAGTQSKLMTYWLAYIKLLDILAFAQRTIYSMNKSGSSLDSLPKWDIHDIVKIDSALNAWVDSLPDHLRWDPHRENITFFNQSCVIYVAYYYTQILVHKPFIPSPGSPPMANMSFPSLAICANAARSCCHVMDVQSRKSFLPIPNVMMPLASAAMILLLNHWGGRRLGLPCNPGQEYADVYKCINVLRIFETRWQVAGRLCDLLDQLLNFDNPKSVTTSSLKRARDSEVAQAPYQTQTPEAESLSTQTELFYNLPFSTNELGQLTVYGSFDFTGAHQPGAILFEDPELVHIIDSFDFPKDNYGLDMAFVPMLPLGEEYSWGDWSPEGHRPPGI